MRVCIVLGAGSSFANGRYFRPRRFQSTLPPLDYTFFQKIRDLGITVPTDLTAYADTLPTGSPFDGRVSGARMEEFLRDLFHDFLRERDSSTSQAVRAYREMIAIYARVLRQTTDWMRGDGYSGGPVGRIISEAAEVADRVDIITFNHDLVIENEIFKRAKLRRRWCVTYGYGSFSSGRDLLETAGRAMFPLHDDSECDHSRPLVIHKMHGSLNWYVRIRAAAPTPGVLSGQVDAPDVMITREREVREIRQVRMRPVGRGRTLWYVWPVIVPPIYAKQALIASFMPSVWSDARDALLHSDRVVFYGYSLPQADIEAEKLFERTLSTSSSLPWVGVIDPEPAVVDRVARLLPNMCLRRFPDGDSFFASTRFT